MSDSKCLARAALRTDLHLACVDGPDVGLVLAPGTVGRAGDVPLSCASIAREHAEFPREVGAPVCARLHTRRPYGCARECADGTDFADANGSPRAGASVWGETLSRCEAARGRLRGRASIAEAVVSSQDPRSCAGHPSSPSSSWVASWPGACTP